MYWQVSRPPPSQFSGSFPAITTSFPGILIWESSPIAIPTPIGLIKMAAAK